MEEMQNEVDEEIKGVDSRDTVKRNEKSDQWDGQLSKLPILLVGFAHPSYTWFLGPTPLSPPPKKRHLDRFSRFCRAQERDQHTDIQTTLHCV